MNVAEALIFAVSIDLCVDLALSKSVRYAGYSELLLLTFIAQLSLGLVILTLATTGRNQTPAPMEDATAQVLLEKTISKKLRKEIDAYRIRILTLIQRRDAAPRGQLKRAISKIFELEKRFRTVVPRSQYQNAVSRGVGLELRLKHEEVNCADLRLEKMALGEKIESLKRENEELKEELGRRKEDIENMRLPPRANAAKANEVMGKVGHHENGEEDWEEIGEVV